MGLKTPEELKNSPKIRALEVLTNRQRFVWWLLNSKNFAMGWEELAERTWGDTPIARIYVDVLASRVRTQFLPKGTKLVNTKEILYLDGNFDPNDILRRFSPIVPLVNWLVKDDVVPRQKVENLFDSTHYMWATIQRLVSKLPEGLVLEERKGGRMITGFELTPRSS